MDFWFKSINRGKKPDLESVIVPGFKHQCDPDEDHGSVRQKQVTFEQAVASLPSFSIIKRHRSGKKFRPLADYRCFVRRVDTEWKPPAGISNKREAKHSSDNRKEVFRQMSEEFPILKFPFVDYGEIDKHKKLNIDAEKYRVKSPCPYETYLELVKRQCEAQKPKKPKQQPPKEEKIPTPKPVKKQPRWFWDIGEESVSDKASPSSSQSPPKWKTLKVSKVVLDFKYSYAVEQYYRQQLMKTKKKVRKSENALNLGDKTEIKLGYVVTTLGANVLNLRARSLPSCNPFEMRMRKQLHVSREKDVMNK